MKNLKAWATIALLSLTMTACGSEKQNLTPKQLAEQNKPGTVMIQAVHDAEIAVPDYTIDEAKFAQLQAEIQQQVSQGSITSEQQVFAILVEEMFTNPLEYFAPTDETIRTSAEVITAGSGSIVTSNGYIVTNAHVVSSESDRLKHLLAESGLQDVVVSGCDRELNQDADLKAAIGATMGTAEYFAHYMQLSQVETKIYTTIGEVTPDAKVTAGYVSEVKSIGKPTPGKDVAILKINAENLPTVTTGGDTLETGDSIYILGYPAAAVTDAATVNEASLTSGLISARKTMPDDWQVLQTDAAMSHGNSGGPVFNDRGEMIGIATFGAIDSDGAAVQGVNFVVPISVIDEFLQKGNVQPQPSALSEQYREAVQLFESEKYSRSLPIFRNILELNPKFPYAQDYISQARSHIEAGDDKSIAPWFYAAVPATLLAGGGAVVWLVRRKRSTASRAIESSTPSDVAIEVKS